MQLNGISTQQVAISAATKAASFIPVYGQAIAIGMTVLSSVASLFGKGHVTRNKFYADVQVQASGVTLLRRYGNSDARKIAGSSNLASDPITALGNTVIDLTKQFGGAMAPFIIGGQYHQKQNALGVSVGRAIVPKQGSDIDISFSNEASINNGTILTFILAVQRGYVKLPFNLNSSIAGMATNISTAKTLLDILVAKLNEKIAITNTPVAPPQPVSVPVPVTVPAPVTVSIPPKVIDSVLPVNNLTDPTQVKTESKMTVKTTDNKTLLIGCSIILLALLVRKSK